MIRTQPGTSAIKQRISAFETSITRHDWLTLVALTLLYALLFSAAAIYKYQSFWMGFDLAVHEQVLWNTMHGRIAAISAKGATHSYLGVDIIITELLLTPLYALLPRTETMLVLQIVIASSGAIPIFLIGRDYAGTPRYGLLAALLYLASLPVQYAILYEFQIRTIGTVCFLWAFLFLERNQFVPFVVAGVLAIWSRSDAGFALAAMGGYALIHRRPWYWVVTPGVVGLGWLALCLKVLIPAFRDDHGFLYTFVYDWLGNSPLDMLHTLLTRPLYVAEHMVTPGKLRYLLELFGPLLFLPLLRPDILLIALPSLLLNLLSPEHIHWNIRYHYQAFIVPFLLIATIYALTDATDTTATTRHSTGTHKQQPPHSPQRTAMPGIIRSVLLAGLLIATIAAHLTIRSPLIHLATRERDAERIAYAHTLLEQIPDHGPVTATSALGAHLARRQEIYFFPGNIIYPPEFAERGEYLVADLHEVPPEDRPRLRQLQHSQQWKTLVERENFILLRRVAERSNP